MPASCVCNMMPRPASSGNEQVIIDRLPASHDHNAGRLRFGPDGKLYYTLGDQGRNQGRPLLPTD